MPWKSDLTKTDGSHETFPIPRTSSEWFRGSANSTVPKTTVEQVRANAQAQEKNAENRLGMFGLKDVKAGSHAKEGGK
jgi:hypothetical protein